MFHTSKETVSPQKKGRQTPTCAPHPHRQRSCCAGSCSLPLSFLALKHAKYPCALGSPAVILGVTPTDHARGPVLCLRVSGSGFLTPQITRPGSASRSPPRPPHQDSLSGSWASTAVLSFFRRPRSQQPHHPAAAQPSAPAHASRGFALPGASGAAR